MKTIAPIIVATAAFLFQGVPTAQAADDEIVTIDSRPNVTVSFAVTRPDTEPKVAAILFAGGNGKLRLWQGRGLRTNNFLVRSRGLFAKGGVLVVTVDAPSDRREEGLDDFRDSAEHRTDITAVLRWLRAQTRVPVWLIGTSRGTVSVAHLAARLPVDGAVFTASVTRASRRRPATVYEGDLENMKMPVLLAHHREDLCGVTPVANVPDVAGRLRNAVKTETLLFEGGKPPESGACQARSAHGFFGIEDEVVGAIVRWMIAAQPR
jgi:pimeloyl-ACP methyl ester carboxylesterase